MAYDFSKTKKGITAAEEWIKKEFAGIRTGQATPTLLDGIKVDSYGSIVPLSQIGSITTEGARSLRITPWDIASAKEVEKAITVANLGVSVVVDDKGLRINFPELTEDRRKEIVKLAKERLEEGKKRIRIVRDEVMKDLQGKEKNKEMSQDESRRLQKDAQKMIDEGSKKLEEAYAKKEKEIQS